MCCSSWALIILTNTLITTTITTSNLRLTLYHGLCAKYICQFPGFLLNLPSLPTDIRDKWAPVSPEFVSDRWWKDIPWEAEFWGLSNSLTSKSTDNCTAWKRPAATSVDTVLLSGTCMHFTKEKKHRAQKGNRNWVAFEYMGWERNALHTWTPSAPDSGRRRVPKWTSVCVTVHKISPSWSLISCKNESHQVILGSWLPLALKIKRDSQSPQLSSKIGLGFGGRTCKPASVNEKVCQAEKEI